MNLYKWLASSGLVSFIRPRGVQILVPAPKKGQISTVRLSPGGDKLLYNTDSTKHFIFDLRTNETTRLGVECAINAWLDNQTLFCWPTLVLVNTNDFSIITTLQKVDARGRQDIASFFVEEQLVYQLEGETWADPQSYVVISPAPQESYYIFNLETVPSVAKEKLISIPAHRLPQVDHLSPDGRYYFEHFKDQWLRIYSSEDDQLVREVTFGDFGSTVAGWSYDSRGVIYKTSSTLPLFSSHPIYILTVPK